MESNDISEIKELLININKKLEFLEDEAKWNHKQWKENQSFSHYLKRWGGFYLANLMAYETLGLNGNNSLFGGNSK